MKKEDFIDFLFEEITKDDIENNPISKEKLIDFSKIEDDEMDGPEDDEKGDSDDKENDDPNRQGLIRNVENAHLVYKRQNSTEQYDELWMWALESRRIEDEVEIKKNILAGTDIPIDAKHSKDNEQYFELKTMGNITFMKLFNLPN